MLRSVLLSAALLPAAAGAQVAALAAQPTVPAVLSEPALLSPKALGAVTLAVTRAGERLVAVGERGTVLLSDDHGVQWRQAKVPVRTTLTAVRFVDARIGWAVGHLGVILRSDDGGETWTKQLDGVAAARAFADAGERSGDPAQKQRARRWADEGPDKPFFDVDFVDAQRGVAVGAYNLAFATADGGKTWTPILDQLPNPKGLHLYGVRLVGERVYIAGEQGLLLRSGDGGASFSALTSPYKGSFFGLLVTEPGTLVVYGLRGNAFRSTDDGTRWDKVETGVPVSISAGIRLADGALALMTQTGEVLVSRDDGRSFQRDGAGEPIPAAGVTQTADGKLVAASLRGVRRLGGRLER
jgi:photosystem II stability/assembly factor-like uncharacterized protein